MRPVNQLIIELIKFKRGGRPQQCLHAVCAPLTQTSNVGVFVYWRNHHQNNNKKKKKKMMMMKKKKKKKRKKKRGEPTAHQRHLPTATHLVCSTTLTIFHVKYQ